MEKEKDQKRGESGGSENYRGLNYATDDFIIHGREGRQSKREGSSQDEEPSAN